MKNEPDTDNQATYWNQVAEIKTFTHPIDTGLLLKYAGPDVSIVDYGCGYGRLVKQLQLEGFNNITGYDTSVGLVARGTREGLPLYHIEAPHHLPFPNYSVDCFLLFAVLTCIPSNKGQLDLISILLSKLKPGGIIYISDYYLQTDTTETGRYTYLNEDPENYGVFKLPEGAIFRHHTPEWIARLLQDFEIRNETSIEVRTMNGHAGTAFQLIAQKKVV